MMALPLPVSSLKKQSVLVPFTGGSHSLQCLIWAIKQNVRVHLVYVRRLFPHNSEIEEQSVNTFVRNIRDYWHEPLWTWDASLKRYQWNIEFVDLSDQEVHHLNRCMDEAKFLHLIGVLSQVARRKNIPTIVWPCTMLQRCPLDIPEFQRRTNLRLDIATLSGEANVLDYIYNFYNEVINEHDDYDTRRDRDSVYNFRDDCDGDDDNVEYRGHFDRDFNFWGHIHCCQLPALVQTRHYHQGTLTSPKEEEENQQNAEEEEVVDDDDEQLQHLCRRCARCVQLRSFIMYRVLEYWPHAPEWKCSAQATSPMMTDGVTSMDTDNTTCIASNEHDGEDDDITRAHVAKKLKKQ